MLRIAKIVATAVGYVALAAASLLLLCVILFHAAMGG